MHAIGPAIGWQRKVMITCSWKINSMMHYCIQGFAESLRRSAKAFFISAKPLPRAKAYRHIFYRQRSLCRESFIGLSAKDLPRAKPSFRQRKVAVTAVDG